MYSSSAVSPLFFTSPIFLFHNSMLLLHLLLYAFSILGSSAMLWILLFLTLFLPVHQDLLYISFIMYFSQLPKFLIVLLLSFTFVLQLSLFSFVFINFQTILLPALHFSFCLPVSLSLPHTSLTCVPTLCSSSSF